MILRLTTIGRQTLADGANRKTRAVTLTRLAAGSGSGPGGAADDARTTLRNQRASADATGATALAGRLVARGDLMPMAAFNVTEVGLFARVGAGAEILLAYWTKGDHVLAAATPGVTLVLAAVIEIQAAAAEVAVTLTPAVTVTGPSTFLGLTDTPDAYAASQLLRADAAGSGVEQIAATALRLDAAQLMSGRVPTARLGRQRYAVALTDVENTAAETNALAFQVGANEMADGDRLRIHWLAVHRNTLGTARRSYVYKLHWGNVSGAATDRDSYDTPRGVDKDLEGSGTYLLDLWRRGATLYWSSAYQAVWFGNAWDDSAVQSLTPAFDAAATVAFSVQLSTAAVGFYYRVRGATAERTSPT